MAVYSLIQTNDGMMAVVVVVVVEVVLVVGEYKLSIRSRECDVMPSCRRELPSLTSPPPKALVWFGLVLPRTSNHPQ
jgi:hypothetical protein